LLVSCIMQNVRLPLQGLSEHGDEQVSLIFKVDYQMNIQTVYGVLIYSSGLWWITVRSSRLKQINIR
jgi:hypothetical protein